MEAFLGGDAYIVVNIIEVLWGRKKKESLKKVTIQGNHDQMEKSPKS
jgi:hypothetical protein